MGKSAKSESTEKLLHSRDTVSEFVTQKSKYHKALILRKDFDYASGKYPVVLRITIDRKYYRHQLNIELTEKEFNPKNYTVTIAGDKEQSHNYTRILASVLAKAELIFTKYMLLDVPLTVDLFRTEWKIHSNNKSFITWAEAERENLKGDLKPSTLKVYKEVIERVKKFNPELRFSELTPDFIDKYNKFLARSGMVTSTRMKHLKTIKTLCSIARKRNLIFADPFAEQKITRSKGTRESLTKENLDKLADLFKKGKLPSYRQEVLRTFLFSCYTGTRYSDCCILDHNSLVGDTLVYTPIKTEANDIKVKMQLSPQALELINPVGKLVPTLSSQKMNAALHLIRKAAEVDQKFTFHVARHTFATQFILAGNGVEFLQVLMGHAKIETTMIYVSLANEMKAQKLQIDKFSKHLGDRQEKDKEVTNVPDPTKIYNFKN